MSVVTITRADGHQEAWDVDSADMARIMFTLVSDKVIRPDDLELVVAVDR